MNNLGLVRSLNPVFLWFLNTEAMNREQNTHHIRWHSVVGTPNRMQAIVG